MPARRAHELRGLNDVVFDLQRRNDFERARADLLIEIGDRSDYKLRLLWNWRNHRGLNNTRLSQTQPKCGHKMSRAAAADNSPGRKPWVNEQSLLSSPGGATEASGSCYPNTCFRPFKRAQGSHLRLSPGFRRGLNLWKVAYPPGEDGRASGAYRELSSKSLTRLLHHNRLCATPRRLW